MLKEVREEDIIREIKRNEDKDREEGVQSFSNLANLINIL